ncbi:MAG TPA: hypothetical protein VK737_00225 [Opitutales bacterium]|nr:hypothetical protein [Opitutales bacterium]
MKKYFIVSVFVLSSASVWACDSCGCEFCEPGGLSLGVFGGYDTTAPSQSFFFANVVQQYTDFGTLRNVPAGVSTDQYEDSFQTQFIFGYQFNQDLTVQLNVPYIFRDYRIENAAGTGLVNNQVNGLGDVRLVVNYTAFRKQTADYDFAWRFSGGIIVPTGDSTLLQQESPTAAPSDLNSPNSAVGGHDLALGSGAYDAVFGTGISLTSGRFFFNADADYTIRGTGEAGYRYSNETSWSAGPGYRIWQDGAHSLGLQFRASGEYKAADTVQGTGTDDTFVSTVELGPNFVFAWNNVLAAHLQLEVPIVEKYDPGFQALTTYRLLAGVTFRM